MGSQKRLFIGFAAILSLCFSFLISMYQSLNVVFTQQLDEPGPSQQAKSLNTSVITSETEKPRRIDCGCPETCDVVALGNQDDTSLGFTCQQRIVFLMHKHHMDEIKACTVASTGKGANGACGPECTPNLCQRRTKVKELTSVSSREDKMLQKSPADIDDDEFPYPLSCPNHVLPTGNYSLALAYHVGMVKNWITIVNDQLRIIQRCGLGNATRDFLLSYANGDLETVLNVLRRQQPGLPSSVFASPVATVKSTKVPWEGNIMNSIHYYCRARAASGDKTVVFYFHNKGASKYTENWRERLDEVWTYSRSLYWRKYMEYFTIERPGMCIDKIINEGASTCGVLHQSLPSDHYRGNFWVADCDYIQSLTPINMEAQGNNYIAAELWVGQNARQDFDKFTNLHALQDARLYRHLVVPEEYSNATSDFDNGALFDSTSNPNAHRSSLE